MTIPMVSTIYPPSFSFLALTVLEEFERYRQTDRHTDMALPLGGREVGDSLKLQYLIPCYAALRRG